MPIKPENKKRYPANWKQIRSEILKRANNRCEFCGIENYTIKENGAKVVLTIAHLDHTPENCSPENLRALCQKCHNTYDAKHRAETRKNQRSRKMDKEKEIESMAKVMANAYEQYKGKVNFAEALYNAGYGNIKQAIKEFAVKLKKKAVWKSICCEDSLLKIITIEQIDELVKALYGDSNGLEL